MEQGDAVSRGAREVNAEAGDEALPFGCGLLVAVERWNEED